MKNKSVLIILSLFTIYLLLSASIIPIYVNMILGGIVGYILGRID